MARSKPNKVSKIDRLEKNLMDLHELVETIKRKERTEEEAKKKKSEGVKPSELIPRPKGRPGRTNGYSIIEKMQLAGEKTKYNLVLDTVRNLVVQHLDITLPLSRQKDRSLIEQVVIKARKDVPFLERYEGGWATRDMMSQYLRNRSGRTRRLPKEPEVRLIFSTVNANTIQFT
ncbi:hypothetical protein JVT61DRAFT_13449 [Boletus reticuloceps]|uniref:Uncharacterized protein n=1 Tax=Boletus reticuloceps TaxID=495285 RepID=A0A8I3A312_9AGAM|nr:hypothetical protein JVT61DRAFT_13449 [Boletus reticuloceps]